MVDQQESKNSEGATKPERILMLITMQYIRSMTRFFVFATKLSDVVIDIYSRNETVDKNLKGELDQFEIVRGEVGLIYPFALLESYVNGVTSLIFSMTPEKFLGNTSIEIRQLVAKSRANILNESLALKYKSFSREGLIARIRKLEQILEVSFAISDEESDRVDQFIEARNQMIHANYANDLRLADDLTIEAVSFRDSKLIERLFERQPNQLEARLLEALSDSDEDSASAKQKPKRKAVRQRKQDRNQRTKSRRKADPGSSPG